jgi:hypothetical protein
LSAGNANATSQGQDQTFFIAGQPAIHGIAAVQVTGTSALLQALVNPDGFDSQVHFDYGTTTSSGNSTQAADLGSGTSDLTQGSGLTGLTPNTTYHFRAIAGNVQGTVMSADQTFTTGPASCPSDQFRAGPSASLPDCRAYEQVTPVNKDSAQPQLFTVAEGDVGAVAAQDGNRMSWITGTAFPNSPSPGAYFLSSRTSSGWSSVNEIPPQSTQNGEVCGTWELALGFSPELDSHVLADGAGQSSTTAVACGHDDPNLVAGEPQGVQNLFVQDRADAYTLVSPNPVTGPPSDAGYCASTPDLGHVAFISAAQLTPDAPPATAANQRNLYDWSGSGGVHLVNVLPDGTPTPMGDHACDQGGVPGAGSMPGGGVAPILNVVSDDGSKIFFYGADQNVYMRVNPAKPAGALQGAQCLQQQATACTVQVDASQGPGADGGGVFQRATPDGSQVFFADSSKLTPDSTAVSGNVTGPDLYRYDTSTGRLTDLTVDHTDPNGAGVEGVAGISDDGSHVYFVADGVLAANANSHGDTATAGQPNLYLWHAGATSFIATLDNGSNVPPLGVDPFPDRLGWTGAKSGQDTSRVSRDGRYLAFNSDLGLVGNDTGGLTSSYPVGFTQVYLYDASSGRLVCASCSPVGAPATAIAAISLVNGAVVGVHASFPGVGLGGGATVPRNLTVAPDGSARVFFTTAQSLLPADTNGVEDVYEYENGQPHLISSGTSASPSYFLDASQTGDDVFFVTAEQLALSDTDSSYDVYDARVDGGFAASAPPPACVGDGCRPAASPQPAVPTAATVSFSGPGDVAAGSGAASAKAAVLTRTVRGTTFVVRVRVPGAGRVAISGAGVGTLGRSVARAGSYALRVALAPAARRALRRRHRLAVMLRVAYDPPGASAAVASFRVTVLPALRHTTRRARRATVRTQGGSR